MGKFHEQPEIQYIPFQLTKKEALDKFCNFLNYKNTPIDIFERTSILSFEKLYAPQYLFFSDFDFVTELNLTPIDSNGSKVGTSFLSEYNGKDTDMHFVWQSKKGELQDLPSNFFPGFDYCVQHKTKEKDSEMNDSDLIRCSECSLTEDEIINSSQFQEYLRKEVKENINNPLLQKLRFNAEGQRYEFYWTKKYRSDAGDGFEYNITWAIFVAMCIPLYKVSYKYNNEIYNLFVNACNISSGIFSNNELHYSNYPSDTTKVKGLKAKFSSALEKKKRKKSTMLTAKVNWQNIL